MLRGKLQKLREVRWVTLRGDTLECGVIPGASLELGSLIFGATDEGTVRRICTKLFVDFKGYFEDDGTTPVVNNIANRMELYMWEPCRVAINAEVARLVAESAAGEDNAVSD